MYISYVMSLVILFTVSITIFILFSNPDFYYYLIGITLVVLILIPVTFRYSRVLFLYLFGGIKYEARDRTVI